MCCIIVKMELPKDIRARDLFQLPTAISAAGLGLVTYGAQHIDTKAGKVAIGAGRAFDLIDGVVARRTHTESNAGAIADATCDKAGMGIIALALWQQAGSTEDTPIVKHPLIAAITAKNLVNAGATLYHDLNTSDSTTRPTRSGKLSMFCDNVAVAASLVTHEAIPGSRMHKVSRGIGYVAEAAGAVFGAHAMYSYTHGRFGKRRHT